MLGVTLTGNQTWTNNSSNTLTVTTSGSAFTGAFTVSTSAGIFNLGDFAHTSKPQGFAGLTNNAGSTVNLTSGNYMNNSGTLTVNGTLNSPSHGQIVAALNGGGTINLSNQTLYANSGSFSGIYNGSGGNFNISEFGTGLLVLTGSNTYTGVTTIYSGETLQIGNGTTDGSIGSSASISNSGAMLFNVAVSQSYGNVISGSGSLTKQGAGTLTLSASNSYGGSTTIAAGTLQLSGTGSLGNGGNYTAAIANSGTMVFNSSIPQTLSGNISGAGAMTINNGSMLILTGSNSGRAANVNNETRIDSGGTLQLQANSLNTASGTSYALSAEQTANTPLSFNSPNAVLQLLSSSSVTFAGGNGFGGLGNSTVTINVNNLSSGTNQTLTFCPAGTAVAQVTMNVTGGNGYTLSLQGPSRT